MSLHNIKPALLFISFLKWRPTIIIDSAAVHLGRNDDTKIMDPDLKEKVVKVYKNNKTGKFYAFVLEDGVFVNNDSMPRGSRRELHLGDKITMLSDTLTEHQYLVVDKLAVGKAAAAPGPSPPKAIAAAAAPAGDGKASQTAASFPPQLGENATCPVCLETLLNPRTMVPCGHSFCKVSEAVASRWIAAAPVQ